MATAGGKDELITTNYVPHVVNLNTINNDFASQNDSHDSAEEGIASIAPTVVNSRRSTMTHPQEKNYSAPKPERMEDRPDTACPECHRAMFEDEESSIGCDNEKAIQESKIVTWENENDPQNPMNFSPVRKWAMVVSTSLMTFMVSFASSVFSTATVVTAEEFGVSSEVMLLGVALYVLGFAFGPLVWGPASELYGRTLPMWFGMFVFCIMQIPVAVAQNLETIFLCRFLGGLFGSAPLAIVAGMFVDFLPPVERGIGVSIFSAAVFVGPAAGPIAGSFITYSHLGWRWTAWITLIFGAFFTIIAWLTTPETFEPVLLKRKALKLRHETKDFALHAKAEEEPAHAAAFVQRYLSKPVKMLLTEPILIVMTIYMSLVYGILYLTFEAYPIAFIYNRGWRPGIASLPFLGLLVGIFIACIILAVFSIAYVGKRYVQTKKLNPEDRLPTMILGSVLLPIGLFWFAWTSSPTISWVPQVIAGSFIGCGIILIFMSAVVYLVDVYLFNANSAVAINTFVRSCVGAGFPMFATYMFRKLGVDWGASVLGFICLALIPFPILFWKYGRKIRGWSKFAVILPGS